MVMPGDNTEMTVELGKPIAMDEGLRFAIREGGRTVGVRPGHQDPRVADRHRHPTGEDAPPMAADGPSQKIRIRLKAYDHEILDQSTEKIVQTVLRTQAKVLGPVPLPDREAPLHGDPLAAQVQGQPRALRDAGPQAAGRHRRAHARRRSTRSSASTCRPAWTSRSRSRRSRAGSPERPWRPR